MKLMIIQYKSVTGWENILSGIIIAKVMRSPSWAMEGCTKGKVILNTIQGMQYLKIGETYEFSEQALAYRTHKL